MNSFTFPVPTDHAPGSWHAAYCRIFNDLFKRFKNDPIRLMEIGTDGGGMLRSYEDYFPIGCIVGMDISPAPASLDGFSRIHHFQRDAYTTEAVQLITETGPFEILIDDGSHQLGHQEFFCQHYTKLLTDDGIAIVEDIAEHAHIAHLAQFVPPEFFCYGIDLTMHDGGRYDNRLLVIHRK